MYRKLRLSDKKLSAEKECEILKNSVYGVLSTCSEDGQPYGVPLNYVYEDGRIYFHCAITGRKLENIAYSSRVCFTVTGCGQVLPSKLTTHYQSVIAEGKASIITEDKEKTYALRLLISKYSPEYMQEGLSCIEKTSSRTIVVRIDIEDICGKGNV